MLNPPKKLYTCPNCQTPLKNLEPFCPTCGQKNQDILLPLRAHLADIFESVFNWDSRLLRSLKVLFFSPGKITTEFNAGKRATYVPPLRLYLISSLLFFLLLSMTSKSEMEKVDSSIERQMNNSTDTIPINMGTFSINVTGQDLLKIKDFSDEQLDSLLIEQNGSTSFFHRLSLKQSAKAINGNVSGFIQQLTQAGSISMFFLMPAFAWLLMLFFRKPKRFYVEHLILSVHLHTLFFLIFSLNILMSLTILDELFSFIFLCLIYCYPYLYFKEVYGKNWKKTLWLTLLVFLTYAIILIFGLALTTIISLLIF
ncbi:MAG: DUF3667 domain-containing protein [Bacteroidetes bacterium]|nr:DUF3667 domain-containing protein [Bacteroidota bacterium]